jgi:SAM-dependent methyltransferase
VTTAETSAQFYDYDPTVPEDLDFYRALVDSGTHVLELGCGTGRVLVPLARDCATIHGLDASPAMLALCREKLEAAGISGERATLCQGDMADFELGRTFDLVLTPYRSFQSLLDDAQVAGCLACVRRHLAPGGSLVLDAFRPDPLLLESWAVAAEEPCWEVEDGNLEITCHVQGLGVDRGRQVQRLRLIYRQYVEGVFDQGATVELALRYYAPEQLIARVEEAGLEVVERWGGYRGEPWGAGPELLLRCTHPAGAAPRRPTPPHPGV